MRQDRRPRVMIALLLGLAVPVGAAAAPASVSAATAPCKVLNDRTGVSTGKLQPALDAAAAGDTLRITGTCTGSFSIGEGYADYRRLWLVRGATAATLKGSGGRVLTIHGGAIRITGVKVTGGTATDCPTDVAAEVLACGGGIWNKARLTLTKVTISGNAAGTTGSDVAQGGGLHNAPGGEVRLVRSVVTGNTAAAGAVNGHGGGIWNGGTLTVERSTINGNTASGSASGSGGGVFSVYGSTSTMTETTIAGNTAGGAFGGGGGGLYLDGDASLTVRRSTISGNSVEGGGVGGAIATYSDPGSSIRIVASTVSGNRAFRYGAISSWGPVVVIASTITRNSATELGGLWAGGVFTLRSSTLAGNVSTAPDWPIDCMASGGDGERNVLGEGDSCSAFIDGQAANRVGTRTDRVNPKLGPLANNGGPTKTHALLTGSPAIKRGGKPCSVFGPDQRGVTRPTPAGTACDVGAFERG